MQRLVLIDVERFLEAVYIYVIPVQCTIHGLQRIIESQL